MNQEVHFKNIRSEIIRNLNKCESDLKIAVAWFTDKKIINTLNELISRGVKAEIIIYNDHVNKKELFEQLYYSKAKIYLSKKLMHNKFCVIDGRTVINGSYNWTLNASTNDENIQINYNDFEFANKFVEQFEKLSNNCKKIDEFFEYSLSSLENIEYEFEKFYSDWPNYNFPYFINTTSIKISDLNKNAKDLKQIYLIRNNEEEKKHLWYRYILQSKYSLSKLLKIKGDKFELPLYFENVLLEKWDTNNVAQFTNFGSNTVIKKEKPRRNTNYRYYIFSIDKKGQLNSEKYEFTYKIKKGLYINHKGSKGVKPYFIEHSSLLGLKIKTINYIVRYILNSNYLICSIQFYLNDRLTVKNGIIDFHNKVLVNFEFDDIEKLAEYDTRIWDTPALFSNIKAYSFIEHPILVICDNFVYNASPEHYYYGVKNHLIHLYSLEDFSVIKTTEHKSKDNEKEYIYNSYDNFKYKELNNEIYKLLNHRVNIFKGKIPLEEYNKLKKSNLVNAINIVEKFKSDKERKLIEKAKLIKPKTEGCYIATMVYKDYNDPRVMTLRGFRDNKLSKSFFGKILIRVYYNLSPKFVNFAQDKKIIVWISKKIINQILRCIKTWHNTV